MDSATTQSLETFAFITAALNGTGGFARGADEEDSELVRFVREAKDKYARRRQASLYRNYLRSACQRFVGHLFGRKPARNVPPGSLLTKLLDDADRFGNAIDVFWQDFALEAKARGSLLLLVDMPKDIPATRAEQMALRTMPYFRWLAPEDIADYAVDETGRFEWVAIKTQRNQQPAWKVFDKVEWKLQAPGKGGAVFERGEHPLGECPVLIFTERGQFPCVGEFAQIADLSWKWFNRYSDYDTAMTESANPMLSIHEPHPPIGGEDETMVIGTNNAIVYTDKPPAWIAPDPASFAAHRDALADLEAQIREIAYTVDLTAQAEAAAALNLRYKNLNAALSHFAARLNDLEARAWTLAARWVGEADSAQIVWPSEYDLADPRAEMEILQLMQSTAFPQEAVAEQMKKVVRLQFGESSSSILPVIERAIDQTSTEIPPPNSVPQNAGAQTA